MSHRLPIILIASAAALAACGNGSASADSAQVSQYVAPGASNASNTSAPSQAAAGSAPGCYTAADVKNALGFEVRSLTGGMQRFGPMSLCGYAAVDSDKLPGVTVTATISPAADADTTFDRMKQVVRMSRGGNAQPDVIQLGERGLAYSTLSQAKAAAVANGKLYSVEMGFAAVSRFGDKKDGMVELLRKLMGS